MTNRSKSMLASVLMGFVAVVLPIGLNEARGHAAQAGLGAVEVWSGVFTLAQAKRGEKAYKAECGRCHNPDVRLNSHPAFVGAGFLERWEGRSVGDLFMYIKVNMPQDAPDSLTNHEYVDIVAHLLHENRFPPGESELLPEFDALSRIMIPALSRKIGLVIDPPAVTESFVNARDCGQCR